MGEKAAQCSTRHPRRKVVRVSSWYNRHVSDPYVKRAQREGYRSRAAYKLLEIDDREKLLKNGRHVLDLGSAPGGWSQVCAARVLPKGSVIALDLLEMAPVEGVEFMQGDFTEQAVLDRILARTERGMDLVISDMAPNITGVKSVDLPRAIYLAELALDVAGRVLRPGGGFLTKLFHGEGFDDYVKSTRERFGQVKVKKPAASRPRSRETYLLARDFRL